MVLPNMTTRVKKKQPYTPPPSAFRRSLWRVLILLFAVLFAYSLLLQSLALPPEGYRLKVGRGATWMTVATELANQGFIVDPASLRLWLWLHPGDEVLRNGTFVLKPPLSLPKLVQRLGQTPDGAPPLVVIEGEAFATLRAKLEQRTDVNQAISHLKTDELMRALGADESNPEGLFAPDTYILDDHERDLDILRRLYLRQQQILYREWVARAPGLPYKSPYEALIMASIIEKETGLASERSQIAGIFVRRLQQGMRLQTDPTVIYGLGSAYKGNLTKAHLRQLTPYNTYRITGLPPTPITLPGQAAIHAAMHPDPGTAIYFVADGFGKHAFSSTLDEHNAAVKRYLARTQSPKSAQEAASVSR